MRGENLSYRDTRVQVQSCFGRRWGTQDGGPRGAADSQVDLGSSRRCVGVNDPQGLVWGARLVTLLL